MSSILDALAKVQAADEVGTAPIAVVPLPVQIGRRRGVTVGTIAGVGVALVAGVVAVRMLRAPATPPAPAPAPIQATAPVEAPAPAPSPAPAPALRNGLPAPQVVGGVPAPTPGVVADRPWVRLDAPPKDPQPPAPPAAPPAPEPVRDAPVAKPPMMAAPALSPRNGVLVAPKPESVAAAPAPVVATPPRASQLTGVRISFLAYSRVPSMRTVALAMDDGAMVTLREGESSGELQVTRIFPDRVELKRGAESFTVHPHD